MHSESDVVNLLTQAAAAARQAYAPYSGFHVGAALLLADGRVFTGCNVENASFGLTICAERAAVCALVAAGAAAVTPTALAIVADGPKPPAPCGACRQVLAEFAPDELPVYFARATDLSAYQTARLGTLLPQAFRWKGVCAS